MIDTDILVEFGYVIDLDMFVQAGNKTTRNALVEKGFAKLPSGMDMRPLLENMTSPFGLSSSLQGLGCPAVLGGRDG